MSNIATNSQYWGREQKKAQKTERAKTNIQYANVVSLTASGEPHIRFDGSQLVSEKIYRRMRSYEPQIGDRIMLIDECIIGSWTPIN